MQRCTFAFLFIYMKQATVQQCANNNLWVGVGVREGKREKSF